jgi:hypothetical protein
MNELIKIVHHLRLAKGTNQKLKILESYKDAKLWLQFLKYTYDESITYGVSAPPSTNFDECEIDQEMFDILDQLANREITGNEAKLVVKLLSNRYGEIPRLILGRSIKAGISTTSINKVYSELIPVFESMKGRDVPIIEYPVYTSIKFDGVKVFVFNDMDGPVLKTSSGANFKLDSLYKEFVNASTGVYEGELIHKEGKQIHRSVITGKLNSLLAGTKTDIDDYKYMVYDFIPYAEWLRPQHLSDYTPFKTRQKILSDIFKLCIGDSSIVFHVRQDVHENVEQVISVYEYLVSIGYEGVMCRYAEDPYMWYRTNRLIKKKAIKECVLNCIGIIPHTNPDKGIVGSLICEGRITTKEYGEIFVKVNVGSGLDKEDINQTEDYFVGENIEVLYNTVTKTDEGYSLFLPRFKRIQKR